MLSSEDIHEAISLLNTNKVQEVLQDKALNNNLKEKHIKKAQEAIQQSTSLQQLLTDKDLIRRISIMHLKMKELYKED